MMTSNQTVIDEGRKRLCSAYLERQWTHWLLLWYTFFFLDISVTMVSTKRCDVGELRRKQKSK